MISPGVSDSPGDSPVSVSVSPISPILEHLEPRMLLSASPSPFEQEMLWLINDMRTDPADHLDHFIIGYGTPALSSDDDINGALEDFNVAGSVLQSDWSTLTSTAPVAWSPLLDNAAEFHSQYMINEDAQKHEFSGGPTIGERITAAGYAYNVASENIFAYSKSALYGHAGFTVDWGYGSGGMQDPPGHRRSIMDPRWVHVGIAAIAEDDDDTDVGPYVVTQDFAKPWTSDRYLVGTIWSDADADGKFDGGEGFSGVTVTAVGAATYSTTSWGSGGYQLQLPAGTYDVSISGGALEGVQSAQVTIAGENVKLDANPPAPEVVARRIFYNNSYFDGYDPQAGASDDNAVDAGKHALLPDETVVSANYTSYWRGINGIMVDITGLDAGYTPVVGDFGIRINESPDTNTWASWPAESVDVRRDVGGGGFDRVTLTWPDGAIRNQWVEVTVKAGGGLGLDADDVFYFCNAVADTGGGGEVDIGDYGTLTGELGLSGGIDALRADLNRDGWVDLTDFAIMRANFGNSVVLPSILAAPPPPAPVAGEVGSDVFDVAGLATLVDQEIANPEITTPEITTPKIATVETVTTRQVKAATGEYDLRPLGDDLATDASIDDLLADILAESALAIGL